MKKQEIKKYLKESFSFFCIHLCQTVSQQLFNTIYVPFLFYMNDCDNIKDSKLRI